MKLQKRFYLHGALVLLAVTFFGASIASPQDPGDRPVHLELGKGVVTDAINKDSEAKRAGLQAADILLSWTRGDAKGDIESPFDLPEIEVATIRSAIGYFHTPRSQSAMEPATPGRRSRPLRSRSAA